MNGTRIRKSVVLAAIPALLLAGACSTSSSDAEPMDAADQIVEVRPENSGDGVTVGGMTSSGSVTANEGAIYSPSATGSQTSASVTATGTESVAQSGGSLTTGTTTTTTYETTVPMTSATQETTTTTTLAQDTGEDDDETPARSRMRKD